MSAGFQFEATSPATLSCRLFVEIEAQRDIREDVKQLIQTEPCRCLLGCPIEEYPDPDTGRTWIAFYRPVTGELDGNAAAIQGALVEMTQAIKAIEEKLGESLTA